MKKTYLAAAVCLTAILNGCSNSNKIEDLSGSGASFPQPFYEAAFDKYMENTKCIVSYGAIGSGAGIRNLSDKTVDFAGSDALLTDQEKNSMPAVITVPTCKGAVVVVFNIDNLKEINLTGSIVADIFAEKITKWNDSAIVAINPGIKLPDENITPVYRSDGSGTTNNFTSYLCTVNENWKNTIGKGKNVNFPYGLAVKGNSGVAQVVTSTKYSIGYVGSEFAFASKISSALIANKEGKFIQANTETVSNDSYPLCCLTYIMFYQEQCYNNRSINRAKSLINLIKYMLSPEAQNIAKEVYYAPLSNEIIEQSLKELDKLTYNGEKI